jgi:hypothetical protein
MARYGISYYGLSTYGAESPVSYAVNNLKAKSITYGTIKITWDSPGGNWSKIKLVRNSYGFPVDETDGTQLDLKKNGLYEAYKETDPVYYLDENLAQNQFYYYSLFVFERVNFKWLRVGDITGLSVKDYGYSDKLLEYLPNVYKLPIVNAAISVTDKVENETLNSFLKLFAFQLDEYHTLTSLLINRYDTSKLSGFLLPSLLQQLAIPYEPEIGLQQSRILARDAGAIYKGKSSYNGLRDFLKGFTGWAVPTIASVPNPTLNGIQVSHNLMLDYNDSSFEESVGHWSGVGGTLYCLKKRNITAFAISSNVATLTIGAHGYQVGNKITISGSDKPLFNSVTGLTITAITSTSVSYALTASNLATTDGFNKTTVKYPVVAPYPTPWVETTTPSDYPNKQAGIMAIKNASVSAGTVTADCGSDAPITKGIPVTAGTAYTFSTYTVNSTNSRQVTLNIKWYNRFGVLISTATGSATASGTGVFSARPTVTGTAPANTYYAVPGVSIAALAGSASNEYQYFDCALFEAASSATSFDEARQLHITFRATRINELKNPHFALISGTNASPVVTPWSVTGSATTKTIDTSTAEPSTTVWATRFKRVVSNVARVETLYTHWYKVGNVVSIYNMGAPFDGVKTITAVGETVSSGGNVTNYPYIEFAVTNPDVTRTADTDGQIWNSGNALKIVATASGTVNVKSWDGSTTSQLMPIHYPGATYTFSIYANKDEYTTSPAYEAVTPYITWYNAASTVISTSTGATTNVTKFEGSWDRPYVTAVAPSNAAYAVVGINWAATNGHTIWLDAALFEESSAVFDFFDGSSGFGDTPDYIWEGNMQNGARSHFYKNRYAVAARTGDTTFVDKLPLGSTVAIYVGQPKT